MQHGVYTMFKFSFVIVLVLLVTLVLMTGCNSCIGIARDIEALASGAKDRMYQQDREREEYRIYQNTNH